MAREREEGWQKRREWDSIAFSSLEAEQAARSADVDLLREPRIFEPRFLPRNQPRSKKKATLSPNLKLSEREKEWKAAIRHRKK